ncbi:septum formation initiator family protein [Patescibacteria group bacterium]|nr:septum formation initiator family protein [Patescibacteria group bacterium]
MKRSSGNEAKKSFFSRFVIIVAIVILVFFIIGIAREYVKRMELDDELTGLEQELNKLKLDKNNFLESIEAYKSDFFIEQEARARFNLKKDGEKVAIISLDSRSESLTPEKMLVEQAQRSENSASGRTNLLAWWDYFFADEAIN